MVWATSDAWVPLERRLRNVATDCIYTDLDSVQGEMASFTVLPNLESGLASK